MVRAKKITSEISPKSQMSKMTKKYNVRLLSFKQSFIDAAIVVYVKSTLGI